LEQDGLMRVGGRLKRAQRAYESKHPIILPKGHQISRLIISHVHKNEYHSRGINCVFVESVVRAFEY
jgi:hypothetical protein